MSPVSIALYVLALSSQPSSGFPLPHPGQKLKFFAFNTHFLPLFYLHSLSKNMNSLFQYIQPKIIFILPDLS